MYFKVLSDVFRYKFRGIVFFAATVILAGCSSGTQRFASIFPGSATSAQKNLQLRVPADMRTSSYGGVIQSTELPPTEPNNNSWAHNFQHDSPMQSAEYSSDGKIMGAPPRNLGVLPRSQMSDASIFQRNSYIVQSGDTLLSIARQVGVSVDSLKLVNGMSNNSIYIGQVLAIPDRRIAVGSDAKSSNSLVPTMRSSFQSHGASSTKNGKDSLTSRPFVPTPSTKNKKHTEKTSIERMSNREIGLSDTVIDRGSDAVLPPQVTGISRMRWPVRGRLLSKFGQKKGVNINRGIDIAVPEGSSVKAAENGVVIYASDGLKELGNVVMIRHEGDVVTIYGHNSKLVVTRWQKVRRGDEIAKSGISGSVKTPRVYFEVRKNSVPVDPIGYLEN
ncbi:M23 family metallopeptidase [Bartonella sp. CB178]|uniref:M23 family metallopeptidase n=1 Tax=Bartonella sp. CB178 TaxID=3112255 RepID=UPI00300E0676